MTFGIPVEVCPLTLDGEPKLANHLKWLKKREIKDEAIRRTGVFNKIDLPGFSDVLVGKGKPFQQHPGNVYLRQLVELHVDAYTTSRRNEDKRTMVQKILQTISDQSGSFLKKDSDGWWVEVPVEGARVSTYCTSLGCVCA